MVQKETLAKRTESILALRAYICARLKEDEAYKDVMAHTAPAFAPHILSLTVKGFPAETTLNFLSASGICVSAGSACSSNAKKAKAAGALVDFGLSEKDFGEYPMVRGGVAKALSEVYAHGVVSFAGFDNAKEIFEKGTGYIYVQQDRKAVKVPVSEVYTVEQASEHMLDILKNAFPTVFPSRPL